MWWSLFEERDAKVHLNSLSDSKATSSSTISDNDNFSHEDHVVINKTISFGEN